jgi:hypothetical protein
MSYLDPLSRPPRNQPVTRTGDIFEDQPHARTFLGWFLILLVLLSGVVLVYRSQESAIRTFLTPALTPAPLTTPSLTPNPSPTVTPEISPSPLPTATPVVVKPTLRILNGTLTTGAAALARSRISDDYSIRSIGNASRRNYSNTILYYASGKQTHAEELKLLLDTHYQVSLQESSLALPDDLLLVIGST